MRLATYSQRTAATRATIVAVITLVVTIFQGSSANLTLLQHFAPQLQPLATAVWFLLYLLSLGGLMLAHGLNWIFWVTRYRFLLILLLLGTMASITWSVDSAVSMQRTVHLLGSSIIAIYLGFMIPLMSILNIFTATLSAILVLSIGVVYLFPTLGIEHYEGLEVWRGVTTSKNTLGFWAAIAVLLYYNQMARPSTFVLRLGYFCLAMMALWVLYKTNSATSVLALMVGGMVSLYFFIAIRFQLGMVRMGLMAVLFSVVIALVLMNTETTELIGRSGDLTGRGEVWSQTWKLILDRPLTGYGYGSIWNPNDDTIWIQQSLTDFSWVVYHAHNGFLQIASEIGIPLSFLALLMVIQQVIEIFYCQYDRQQVGVLFVLGFVIAYLVSNYSEARFLVNRELYWIFFLALPISMLRQVDVVLDNESDLQTESGNDPSLDNSAASAAVSASANKDDLDLLFEKDHSVEQEQDRADRRSHLEFDQAVQDEDKFDKLVDNWDSRSSVINIDINLQGDDPDNSDGK